MAANFAETLEHLQPEFEKISGHRLRAVVGSTGKLYAQIINGAPFDVFLSADQERPQRLVDAGLAVPASRFTYATGELILWTADETRDLGNGAKALAAQNFRKIAIPNPQLAPYGAAAQQVLEKLGLWQVLQGRIVMGENVGQTYSLVASGNAEIGFVSQSSYLSVSNGKQGVFWAPSTEDHAPIHQDAVVLKRAVKNPAAAAFVAFLKGDEAQTVLKRFGYREDDR
ncbi:MAG: molybdate ABC transporter substrate-binding protein [Rhizobiales bacterium]|nr:molybdate ABC transporter substrate-binding protein [Hyphomicrobiales bacterium]